MTAELVKHCQDLLRFAQREDWDEHTRPALESALERLSEPSLFTGPRPAAGLRVITSRAFHDQHIDFLFGEDCCLHDGLIVEIDVAGVKDGFAFGPHQDSG